MTLSGNFYQANVNIGSGDNSAVASLPVLLVNQISYSGRQAGRATNTDPKGVRYFGVGFGQEAASQPYGLPSNNPLLNIISINGKAVDYTAKGYVITPQGVTIGLTAADTAGFSFTNLTRNTANTDWNKPSATITVNGVSGTGTALTDTGIGYSYLTHPPGSTISTIPDSIATGAAPSTKLGPAAGPGTVITIAIGTPGTTPAVSYSVTIGDGTDGAPVPAASAPALVHVNPGDTDVFFNTSFHFFNAFNYVYDATDGEVGFKAGTVTLTPASAVFDRSTLGSNATNTVAAGLVASITAQLGDGSLSRTSPSANPLAGNGLATVSVAGSQVNLAETVTSVLVTAGGGNVTVVGSGGLNQSVLIDNTNTTFNTQGGTGTVVTGDGNNVFATASSTGGPFNFQLGNGNNIVFASTGSNTVSAGTGSNIIGSGSSTPGANGNNQISVMGRGAVIGAGSGTDTIFGGAGPMLVSEGARNLVFVGGTGAATVFAGTGSYTVAGGAGGGLFAGGAAGGNVIATGTSQSGTTIFGGAAALTAPGDNLFAQGSGNNLLVAGTGNATLTGTLSSNAGRTFATGNNTYFASTTAGTANTVFVGAGADTIWAGAGNDTLVLGGASLYTGGAKADLVAFGSAFTKGTGNISITGFRVNIDKLVATGYTTPPTFAASAANTVITLGDNTRITVSGVSSTNASTFF